MPRSRQLSIHLVVFGTLLVVLLGACGGGDDEPDTQPTTTAPPTTESQEAQDEAALRQLAEDWYAASDAIYQRQAEPEAAEEFLVDPYLSAYTARANDLIDAGQTSQPSDRSSHEVTDISIDGDEATVMECIVDADVLLASDGSVVNDEVVASVLESDAVRADGGWVFEDSRTLAEEVGVDQCPEA